MKEIYQIIAAYKKIDFTKQTAALATVVYVEGSSYRRPGARMLITGDGKLTGSISGGCLEGDALRKAQFAMAQKKNTLATYDTTDEDDAKLGIQLGCNGIVHILIEPLDHLSKNNPVLLLEKLVTERTSGVLVVLFSLANRKAHQPGTCYLKLDNKSLAGSNLNSAIENQLKSDVEQVFLSQESTVATYFSEGDELTGFLEFIKPPISVVIAGAGNDAIPLVEMCTIIGWRTTIIDGRPNYATRERFPQANEVIVAKSDQFLQRTVVDEQTVFVLMTHNYNYDVAVLKQVLSTSSSYVGVLGPRKKLHKMLDDLALAGFVPTEDQLSKIFGPVGFDIGAETAEEIALAITAEIKAVLTGYQGGSLRYKKHTIHERSVEQN